MKLYMKWDQFALFLWRPHFDGIASTKRSVLLQPTPGHGAPCPYQGGAL
jgi:hypothetical protein